MENITDERLNRRSISTREEQEIHIYYHTLSIIRPVEMCYGITRKVYLSEISLNYVPSI
jgi:hypothetical protein